MNKRFQIFISSTYADLKEERAKVIQTIMELDCIPAGMEIFPAIDEEQFEFIKKVIDDCDYYLLIIGGRYGSLSEEGISYTEMEYDYAISKGLKVIAFVHSNPDEIPLGKSEKDSGLRQKLQDFRDKVSTNRLIKFWNSANELPGLVALSLSKTIKTYPAIGWVRANTTTNPEVYKELSDLRKENQELRNGIDSENNFSQSISAEELADLEDKIKVSGTHRFWSSYHKSDRNSKWDKSISWNEIFSILSPYLLDHPSDSVVKATLGKAIYKMTDEPIENGSAKINDQDFQTIKIQFKALGLINLRYSKTTNGGMALFWDITDEGENLMINLRSIKK